ncbi:MAG: UvrD-helicase domain-containing protein [Bacilli bacterium]|nr:UvrD-helicase domain-containing protein [Bacilli bacterium]
MPKWTDEQQLAIDKDNTNIIVSAGAGSGKTAVLTARVLRKLKDGIDINKLLVLTFTNEAAGEMKNRIRKAIKEEPSLKEQLDLIDSSYITTFDSFALSILKKYHYLLNMPKDISIVESAIVETKKIEVLNSIFDKLYEKEEISFLKLIKDFCIRDDTEIKNAILTINTKLDLKEDKEDYLNNYIDNYYNHTYIDVLIDNYISKITSIKNEIETIYHEYLTKESDKVVKEYEEQLLPLINSNTYEDIKNNLDITPPRKVEDKTSKEKVKELIDNLKELTIYQSTDEIKEIYLSTKPYLEAIINIIKELDYEIKIFKDRNNSYEFTDVAKMAIKILKENKEVRDEIKYFYNEIMIDEYQDTNDLQEIFISEIQNNNVYMVGDIKQSIYRFRNANPSIFKNKYDMYSNNENGFKIDLTKNFRSREEVLLDINKIFDKIMNNFLGGAEYKQSHRMVFGNKTYEIENDSNISNFLELYSYDPKSTKYTNEEVEAFIIAKDIKEKINSNYTVLDKETEKLRKARYDDFCIIMDRGTSFDLYKKVFEYENIPLSIYKDETLTASYDVLIIKNIIKFIIKIKDKEYDTEFRYLFTSLARSYLFEYTDEYIFDIFKNNEFYNTDIYKISKNISKEIDNLTTNEFINRIIEDFNIYQNIIKTNGIEGIIIRTIYLQKMINSLETLKYTPYDVNNFLEGLTTANLDIKYKQNNKQDGSVKIMNIHKSKGLEFPICYYSGLYKRFKISDFNDKFLYNQTYGIITPYYKDAMGILPQKHLSKDIYIREEISEKIRLLYVAVTRAKEKMIFVGPLNSDIYNKEELVNDNTRLKYRSFLDIVNTIKDDFDTIKYIEDLSFVTKDYQKFKDIKISIEKTNPLPVKDIKIDYVEKNTNKFSKTSNKLLSKEELFILNKGNKVHYAFEITDFKNPNFNIKYGDYIKRFLSNKLLKNIPQADIYKEYEFTYVAQGSTYHGIIDLMLVYEDHIDIIDYKLSNIEDSNYIKQLKGYREHIENKTGLKTNTYLYSIEKDEFKEVP